MVGSTSELINWNHLIVDNVVHLISNKEWVGEFLYYIIVMYFEYPWTDQQSAR